MKEQIIPGIRSGTVRIPASKSMAHRALICAAFADRESQILCDAISRDIEATIECLQAMGARILVRDGNIRIRPVWREEKTGEHENSTDSKVLPCGESGSTLRFLLPLAGACGVNARFCMEGRLPQRPMQEYEKVLSEHGMRIQREGTKLLCSGQLLSGEYILPGNISSQYISGLLFALPLLHGDSQIRIQGNAESADYIHMTVSALRKVNIRIRQTEDGYLIPGDQRMKIPEGAEQQVIEGDYSSAAFFLCMGAFSDKGITAKNLAEDSLQGDRRIREILQQFGAQVMQGDQSITVRRGDLKGICLDGSMIPDLLPVLSVVAAAAAGETRIFHAERLRMKESDRIKSTVAMLKALGADAEETPDGMCIRGGKVLMGGAEVDPFRDHRIAMSAAVGACLCRKPVSILDSECTAKSYPGFWKDYHGLHVDSDSIETSKRGN